MKTSNCYTLILFLTFLALFVYGGLYVLKLVYSESHYCDEGDLSYHLLIRSRLIRNFPKINNINKERYYYTCGPADPGEGILYISNSSREEIVRSVDEYLKSYGYIINKQRTDVYNIVYEQPDRSKVFELNLMLQDDGTWQVMGIGFYVEIGEQP